MRSAVFLLASILASPALAQPAQFNLRCIGTQTTVSATGKKTKPYETVYRIDLNAGRWCEDECRVVHSIADVQPIQITLTDKEADTPSERSLTKNFINRETGEHFILSDAQYYGPVALSISLKWEGHCEAEAFEAFPEARTKF